LIFAELGLDAELFSNRIDAALVIVISLTTVLPPLAMKWFYARYAQALEPVNRAVRR
jgi:hypothetical protein